MIDPEFWSDEEIGMWSHSARLFYIALWNFADDEGRFKAHSALLKSQIFPYDAKVNIDKLKTEIGNKVQWYEADGLIYGYLRNFLKYQRIDRPQPSKLPTPKEQFDECSTNVRGHVLPNIREVKRSKENNTLCPFQDIDKDEFQRFKETILTAWNELAKNKQLSVVRFIEGEREKNLLRLYKNKNFMGNWKEVIEKSKQQLFLFGKNERNWKMDFDFLVGKDKKKTPNWVKILETRYGYSRKN